jgi:hypothetical protein
MSIATPESMPFSRDRVVDCIRTGVLRAKGVRLPPEEITESTAFWPGGDPNEACLYFDSLDFLELVVFLEQEYGWVVPETAIDVQDCRTVGSLATVVINNVAHET